MDEENRHGKTVSISRTLVQVSLAKFILACKMLRYLCWICKSNFGAMISTFGTCAVTFHAGGDVLGPELGLIEDQRKPNFATMLGCAVADFVAYSNFVDPLFKDND